MDGVITTEEKYWACARLTLWELVTHTLDLPDAFGDAVHDDADREAVCSDDLIYALKSRAVNSNWDIAYVLVCVYIAALPSASVQYASDVDSFLQAVRASRQRIADWPAALEHFLTGTTRIEGRALIEESGRRLQNMLGFVGSELSGLLRVDGPFWWDLHTRFQRFYHGEAMAFYGGTPLIDGTVLPAEMLKVTLQELRFAGYSLGVATGRPLDELDDALGELGLMDYFDADRMGTLDRVRQAEADLGLSGLSKPHPYSLLRALYPGEPSQMLLDPQFQMTQRDNVLMIGDSTSDVVMAKAAGCRVVGVLTGVRGAKAQKERQKLLEIAGCEAILEDVTRLPDWLTN